MMLHHVFHNPPHVGPLSPEMIDHLNKMMDPQYLSLVNAKCQQSLNDIVNAKSAYTDFYERAAEYRN